MEHQSENNRNNAAVSLVNFIQQYLSNGTINSKFDTKEYRLELQQKILRSSTNMNKTCIVCGTLDGGGWVCCDCCGRWCYLPCIDKTDEDVKEDTIHYFCIIYEGNPPREVSVVLL